MRLKDIVKDKGLRWRRMASRWLMILVAAVFACGSLSAAESTRKERRLINEGNSLYRTQKYADAKVKYRDALNENGSSAVARFNLGLCDVRLAYLNKDNDSIASKLMADASSALLEVAKMGREKPSLASKANYNLGNLSFETENYKEAISFYKQALRLDPAFDDARRNLRIAQLKLQEQQDNQNNKDDQNKDQDQQDQDKQDQDQDKQDQDQQNQDRQENDSDKDRQNQQSKPNELSEQAAQQILNAVENNEQKARQGTNKGQKARGSSGRQKRW